jgi:hypothetical protein
MGNGQQALLFILKSFVFTVVWFFTWFFVLNPISNLRREADIEAKQQAEIYAKQLNDSGMQLAEMAAQQKRMGALLSHYEQQAARYDLVLQRWEVQTKIRK